MKFSVDEGTNAKLNINLTRRFAKAYYEISKDKKKMTQKTHLLAVILTGQTVQNFKISDYHRLEHSYEATGTIVKRKTGHDEGLIILVLPSVAGKDLGRSSNVQL